MHMSVQAFAPDTVVYPSPQARACVHAHASKTLRHQIRRDFVYSLVGDTLLLPLGRERHDGGSLHKTHSDGADTATLQHNQVALLTQEVVPITQQHGSILVEFLEVLALVGLDQRHYLAGRDRKLLVAVLDVLRSVVANDLHLGRVTLTCLRQVLRVLIPTHFR